MTRQLHIHVAAIETAFTAHSRACSGVSSSKRLPGVFTIARNRIAPSSESTDAAYRAGGSHAIGYLTSQYARSSDTFIRGEVAALRGMGFEVATFSIRRPPGGNDSAVESEQRATTYLLEYSKHGWFAEFLTSLGGRPKATIKALRLALTLNPGGLKAFVQHLAYFAEAILLAKFLRARNVIHLHNHIAENSATVAMLVSELTGIPWSMTVHGPGIFYRPDRWSLGKKIEHARFVVCITHFCRSQCMVFSHPKHWDKLKIVHCGLDESFLNAETRPIPSDLNVVCVGRLCPEKGQALLVRAVARLVSEGSRVHLSLIGDGEDRELVETLIRENGLETHVSLLGWQSSSEIREHLASCRALVLASFAEGLPVVIMEALALGRPVLSTRIAGIPELVEPGHNGWLVPPGDLDSLTDSLREVLSAPIDVLETMGRAGREKVLEQHDIRTEVEKLVRLFEASTDRADLGTDAVVPAVTDTSPSPGLKAAKS